ncbi:MAG: VWA domain-containing protein [Clostridia bacterium]|nr:VWA domain-containing protein [Clostridia bacterium]
MDQNFQNGFFEDLDFGDFSAPAAGGSRKVPICLVLDCSGSMRHPDGTRLPKIDELNRNIDAFLEYVRNDPKASKICDLCIITMGDAVRVVTRYTTVDRIHIGHFSAGGGTPLGTAMATAIDLLTERRQFYRDNDIEHYKPILMVMTDGEPTDDIEYIAPQVATMVANKEIKIFPVGVGLSFKKDVLEKFSPLLSPKLIRNSEAFDKLFKLLSASSSNPNDDSLEKWFNNDF